jgi:hypothetical protein
MNNAISLNPLLALSLSRDEDEIGDLAICNEGLLTVQLTMIAPAPGLCSEALEVGAGMWLTHRDRAYELTFDQARRQRCFCSRDP